MTPSGDLPGTGPAAPDAIADIHRAAGGEMLEQTTSFGNTFWRSEGMATHAQSYEARVPKGLHLGCGIARLRTHADGIGGFAADGPAINILHCTEPTGFRSEMAPGRSRACGLWFDPDQIDTTGVLGEVVAAVGSQPSLRSSTAIPARVVARLCAPIDPWFDGPGKSLVVEARGLELLAAVLTWLMPEPRQQRSPTPRRQILAAREFIETRLQDPPTLREIASAVGLNERSLTTAFRQAFGVSVAAFVTARRLDMAAVLLSEGASAGEAARRVGYRSTHLAVAFRRRFGVSPSVYRTPDSG